MTQDVNTIVAELLELDPSLGADREELRRTVETMLAARPETPWNPEFGADLRARLMKRADLLQRREAGPSSSSPSSFFLMLNRTLFAGGGAVVGALLVFVLSQQMTSSPLSPGESKPMAFESGPAIADLPPGAFGTLQPGQPGQGGGGVTGMGGDAVAPSTAMNESNDTDEKRMATQELTIGIPTEPFPMPSPDMPPWNPVNVEYVYEGDTQIQLPEGTVEVLRRNGFTSAADVSTILSGLGGFADWSSFAGMRIQNIHMMQDRPEPWSVSIDFQAGSMDIHRQLDWSKNPQSQCQDEACFARYRIQPSDIPADEQLIAIADAFTQQYGIDRSGYGAPQVNNEWRRWYDLAEDKSMFYAPEQVTVIYPLLINGKPVYEEYGQPVGLNIGIDIRRKEAVSAFGFQSQRYERSSYDSIADREKFDAALRKGGVSSFWYDMEGATTVQASLGDPEQVYLRHYSWDNTRARGTEIFVPALAFEVTDQPNEGEQRTRVVIPLAADLFDNPSPPVQIMR